jgi:hypothetical protein
VRRIIKDIKYIMSLYSNEKFWITWYGSVEIDSKKLVIWICVESDELKSKFETDSKLLIELNNTLAKNNYPSDSIPFVHIGFESQETVNRESNGDWYKHFK